MNNIVDTINALPADWHGAGTMSQRVLAAMAEHSARLRAVKHSAETGSGKTTLLFSHLSRDHTVFALNIGDSVSRVTNSSLFNGTNVKYIEGPSQATLPRHVFTHKLDMVLIDGPHGYPFPDLEYYFLYPHIATGGLLVIDDINIPTIRRMFDIIKEEDMFELLEVVEYTAFFRRTSAPAIDPLGDSWWLQGFNRLHYENVLARESAGPRARLLGRLLPLPLKRLVPQSWRSYLMKRL